MLNQVLYNQFKIDKAIDFHKSDNAVFESSESLIVAEKRILVTEIQNVNTKNNRKVNLLDLNFSETRFM